MYQIKFALLIGHQRLSLVTGFDKISYTIQNIILVRYNMDNNNTADTFEPKY